MNIENEDSVMLEGANPSLTVMDARKLHIKSFDAESQMATLSLEDLQITKVPRLNDLMTLIEIVRLAFTNYFNFEFRARGWQSEIMIAGSAPLLLLENILKFSSDGNLRGRWMNRDNIEWNSNDVDIFVGGATGETGFNTFAYNFTRALKEVSRDMGHRLMKRRHFHHEYIIENRFVQIIDYQFANVGLKLQTIQSPVHDNAGEVVHAFDIDIAKVMYNPITGLLHAPLKTILNVDKGIANVIDFTFHDNAPNLFELSRVNSTFGRLRKYSLRGYTFLNYPRLITEAEAADELLGESDSISEEAMSMEYYDDSTDTSDESTEDP